MTNMKIEAMFEEFPFLKDLVEMRAVSAVKVARIDDSILDEIPDFDSMEAMIAILDDKGNLLTKVGEKKIMRKTLFRRRVVPYIIFDMEETVGTAMIRAMNSLGPFEDVPPPLDPIHFVVILDDNKTLTLYKPPKGFTILEWFKEKKRRARIAIQYEVAKIDKEGEKPADK